MSEWFYRAPQDPGLYLWDNPATGQIEEAEIIIDSSHGADRIVLVVDGEEVVRWRRYEHLSIGRWKLRGPSCGS